MVLPEPDSYAKQVFEKFRELGFQPSKFAKIPTDAEIRLEAIDLVQKEAIRFPPSLTRSRRVIVARANIATRLNNIVKHLQAYIQNSIFIPLPNAEFLQQARQQHECITIVYLKNARSILLLIFVESNSNKAMKYYSW